jgi:hypothetical protein
MTDKWRRDGAGKWMAYRLDDGELIGRGGLSWTELDGERRLEVGWTVREKHRRCGTLTCCYERVPQFLDRQVPHAGRPLPVTRRGAA